MVKSYRLQLTDLFILHVIDEICAQKTTNNESAEASRTNDYIMSDEPSKICFAL